MDGLPKAMKDDSIKNMLAIEARLKQGWQVGVGHIVARTIIAGLYDIIQQDMLDYII